MNVFVHESLGEAIGAAVRQVLNLFTGDKTFQLVDVIAGADVVIVQGSRILEKLHRHEQQFLLLLEHRETAPANVPDNVQMLKWPFSLPQCVEALMTAKDRLAVHTSSSTVAESKPNALQVLVIDDSQHHCAAARSQLATEYNLMVVSTYQQALEALQKSWDVVLTDLMMPASAETLGTDALQKYAGQETPLGFVLAFLAAKSGTKHVAVVTDLNHHAHPISAALDRLQDRFTVNGATVMFFNNAMTAEGKDWKRVLETLLK